MTNNCHVLVVDDDAGICEMMTDVLELEGYSVTAAYDGGSAIACIGKEKFDVVLMDMKMPGMNGVETLKEIRKIAPGLPVIMITAFAVEDMIRESIREGAFAAMRKPLDFALLFSTIEAARGRGGLILVADDDENICSVMYDNLTEKGYRVEIAEDGMKAVEKTRDMNYDAIILDIHMPVINGYEAFLSIREIRPDAIVIIITGYPEKMKDLVQKSLNKGAHISLTKPVDMDSLFEILEEIVNLKNKE